MIVKNEAHIVRQCLDSVAPLLDCVVVSDTGSHDGTQDVIRTWCVQRGVPVHVFDEPWRDFSSNRNRTLDELCLRPEIDYALVMDADDILTISDGVSVASLKAGLAADVYTVEVSDGGVSYRRPHVIRNGSGSRYRGVLHEFLHIPSGQTTEALDGLVITSRRLGDRSRDPEKYAKDAAVLERALSHESDEAMRARYYFYLAQSYKDAGDHEKAIANYRARASKGLWVEEQFISLYRIAQLMECNGYPDNDVLDAYLQAATLAPHRLEAVHGAARFCRIRERYLEGYKIALPGHAIKKPAAGLFIENWVYDYAFLDEFSILAYWAGEYRQSLDACLDLLMCDFVPAEHLSRIKSNARFARAKVLPAWEAIIENDY